MMVSPSKLADILAQDSVDEVGKGLILLCFQIFPRLTCTGTGRTG